MTQAMSISKGYNIHMIPLYFAGEVTLRLTLKDAILPSHLYICHTNQMLKPFVARFPFPPPPAQNRCLMRTDDTVHGTKMGMCQSLAPCWALEFWWNSCLEPETFQERQWSLTQSPASENRMENERLLRSATSKMSCENEIHQRKQQCCHMIHMF